MAGVARGVLVAGGRRAQAGLRPAPEQRHLLRDLVVAVPCDELGGWRVWDHAGRRAATVIATAATAWQATPYGSGAIDLSHTEADHIELPHHDRLDFDDAEMTAIALIRYGVSTGADQAIISKNFGGGATKWWELGIDTSGLVQAIWDNGASSNNLLGATAVSDGEWHWVGMLNRPGDERSVWVDAVKEAAGAPVSGTINSTEVLKWGERANGSKSYSGSIGAAFLWRRGLSDADMARVMRDPLALLRPWRPVRVSGGGGTTHALSGTLAASVALGARVDVRRAIEGSLTLALAGSAGVRLRHGVAGALPLALAADAGIDVRRALAGSLPFALLLDGAIEGAAQLRGELAIGDAGLGGLAGSDAATGGLSLSHAQYGHLEVSDG